MRKVSPKTFISYSHDSAEHADRVLAFSGKLRADGVETVLDRYVESPREGWPRWMDRHIRDSDFVLMICTDTYYRRVMGEETEGQGLGVRWEGNLIYNHIYDAGTQNIKFVPILFTAEDRKFIPTPLKSWSYYNVNSDDGYRDLYRRLTEQSATKEPRIGKLRALPEPNRRWSDRPPNRFINVPRLPDHYLKRSVQFDTLKNKILRTSARSAVTGSSHRQGLQGMAGIGKTVLAVAICHDPDVREHFPDGIVWLTLGQTPAIERRQIDLYGCFTEAPLNASDIESGRIALSRLLANKRCMIVLDDVWELAHAKAFDVLGDGGAFLITTRDAGLVRRMALDSVSVDVLAQDEAESLLEAVSGAGVKYNAAEAREIISRCDYLPLAITMIGAMVRGLDEPFAAAIARLNTQRLDLIREEFRDYPYPNLLLAIQASVEGLLPKFPTRRACYLDLGIFPEDTHIPAATLQKYWVSKDVDEVESKLILRDLTEKSLLFRDEHDRYFLHDLQGMYVRTINPDTEPLHKRLVDCYNCECQDGWATGPDDGYFFQHLIFHLAAAGRVDEALLTITDFRWLKRQLERDGLSAVVSDCDALRQNAGNDDDARTQALLIRDTVKLAGHRLEQNPESLAEQLYGRLSPTQSSAVARLLSESLTSKTMPWFRPLAPSLARASGRLQRTIEPPASPKHVAILPSKEILVAAADTVYIYHQHTGVLLGELGKHVADISALTVCTDGEHVVTASQDGGVTVWNRNRMECVWSAWLPGSGETPKEHVVSEILERGYQENRRRLPDPILLPQRTCASKPVKPRAKTHNAKRRKRKSGEQVNHIKSLASIANSTCVVAGVGTTERYYSGSNSKPRFGLWLIDIAQSSFTFLPVGHTNEVEAVISSPSGSRIVSGADDGTIRVWNLETQSLEIIIFTVEWLHHGSRIGALAVSPDGQQVLSVSRWSGGVTVWDIATGRHIKTIVNKVDFSKSLALSRKTRQLFVGGYGQFIEATSGGVMIRHPEIHVWNCDLDSEQEMLIGHHEPIECLAVDEESGSLVSCSWDHTIRIWDVNEGRPGTPDSTAFTKEVETLALRQSGDYVLAASGSTIRALDTRDNLAVARTFAVSREDGRKVEGVAITPDGTRVVVAVGMDKDHNKPADVRREFLEVYDFVSGDYVASFQDACEVDPEIGFLQGLKVTLDGAYAVAVGMYYGNVPDSSFGQVNQGLAVWALGTGKIERVIPVSTPEHGKPFAEDWPTATSSDGRYFAFATVEDRFRLCDLRSDFKIRSFGEHNGWIGGLTFLTRAGLIVTAGGYDETLRAWSIETAEMVWEYPKQGRMKCIASSPSEKFLVIGTDANEIRVLAVENVQLVASFRLDAPVTAVDVQAPGRKIVAGDETGRVHGFEIENLPDWCFHS